MFRLSMLTAGGALLLAAQSCRAETLAGPGEVREGPAPETQLRGGAAFPFVNHDGAAAQVLPLQTEALLRPQRAIERDRIGIRASWLLRMRRVSRFLSAVPSTC